MKLGEIARVTRGVVTGNGKLFTMSRSEAKERGLEKFTKPLLGGASAFPKDGKPVIRDSPEKRVLLIVTARECEDFPEIKAYLGDAKPVLTSVKPSPIAVTYTGTPRFVANPDGLVITNSLYNVTPRKDMSQKEILALVNRLNEAARKLPKSRFAERYTPRSLEALEFGAL